MNDIDTGKKIDIETDIDQKRSIRNEILRIGDVDSVIKHSLALIKEKLNLQTASIFLFTKEGFLSRTYFVGHDRGGHRIEKLDFEESYRLGDSFIGKAAIPANNSNYGKTLWTNAPEDDERIDPNILEKYSEVIGKINCVIDIPLDGQNRTYGVIEVINKIDRSNKPLARCEFNKEEVDLLSEIGSYISTAISKIKTKKQIRLLSDASQILITSPSDYLNAKEACEKVLRRLVSKDTSFRAAILRVVQPDGMLRVFAKEKDNNSPITWEGRLDDDREPNSGLCAKVFRIKEPEIVIIDDDNIDIFLNKEWIAKNKLKSFGCFPILSNDEPLGTLSIFSSYAYTFYDSSRDLIKIIASDIASFIYRIKQENIIRKLERNNEYFIAENHCQFDVNSPLLIESTIDKIDSRLIHEFNLIGDRRSKLPMLFRVSDPHWQAKVEDLDELYRLGDIIGCYGSVRTIQELSQDEKVIYVQLSDSFSEELY
jgi:GAF domain-containing protein